MKLIKHFLVFGAIFIIISQLSNSVEADSVLEFTVAVCSNDNVHVTYGSYRIYFNNTNEWRKIDTEMPYGEIIAGSDDKIYEYKNKRDCNGKLLGQATTKRLLDNPYFEVVIDENGQYIYFGSNGTIDSRNNLHVIETSQDETIYKKVSSDSTIIENKTLLNYSIGWPRVDVDSQDNIHIIGGLFPPLYVFHMKLDNNGTILVNATKISEDLGDSTLGWDLRIDYDDNVHIVYTKPIIDAYQLMYIKLGNNGDVLVDNLPLTSENLLSEYPSLDVDSHNNVYIVWKGTKFRLYDGYEKAGIYYIKLDSNGNVLSGPTNLTSEEKTDLAFLIIIGTAITVIIAVAVLLIVKKKRSSKEKLEKEKK